MLQPGCWCNIDQAGGWWILDVWWGHLCENATQHFRYATGS